MAAQKHVHTDGAHRGLRTVVVENNSCERIRGSRNISWSQVSVGITRTNSRDRQQS